MDMETTCFQLITAAGSAKSDYLEAINTAKDGDFEGAQKLIESGDVSYREGHTVHSKLVQQEAAGSAVPVGLLLIHVEDQMMAAEIFRAMAVEMIGLYKKLADQDK
ncbi:PTS lactose/cellobiose transporter subunit IIA [Bifidobacterium callimiconis]|uniref:PTS cellobiose transporter subunit IIA n=1 Tax=Bifidobacterium callimiconis TaxID=2306973 RepID=A0A430FBR2_9BIFI|nr:PTS lactose/cellobiose transporter subunit IIA [Bifidobacterium callimiconis]MBT1177612.1 PTS lactose/cellobiose transporter subunit IIA [Bifidobacterium callimiconis]RSX50285.1 PTS cellobiose transporter subunit IIA [Bifidobacterium callimiconis]